MERAGLAVPALALGLLAGCESYSYESVTTPAIPAVANPAVTIVGSGVAASETRPVPGFGAVAVGGPFRVVLAPGAPSLDVTADDNVLPLVRSEVRGDTLFLGFTLDSVSLVRTREILVRATLPELREARASGAAVIEVSGVDTERLTIDLSGAAAGSASGVVDELTLLLSGASRWTGAALRARSVRATLSGASTALQRVSDSLRADLSGASTLEYLGDPAVVSNVSGASLVRRLGP
jgi:hypothetical protein